MQTIFNISSIFKSNNNGGQVYSVSLLESGGNRSFYINLGVNEAQSLALAVERKTTSRPLTHELLHNILGQFGIKLEFITIVKYSEGVFYSTLVCKQNERRLNIDSRTSDALVLATKVGCNIYVDDAVLGALETATIKTTNDLYNGLSIKELNNRMNELLDKEDYLGAADIRDEINRRNKK